MTSSKQVVSMLTSEDKVTLFTMTGEVVSIVNDGQYDIPRIVEYLTPLLTGTSAVEFDLTKYTLFDDSVVKALEVESEGIIITQMIGGKEVQGIFYPAKASVVVQVGEAKVVIPDVENLKGHMKRASDEKSPSVINFLKRLAPVIQTRKHSGEDLMKFIQRSEMPLTNDGRIIAYKRVNIQDAENGIYKDCHTGKVFQQLGSRVVMPVDLVDSSRHHSCSTGLHVCNLGYLGGFSGTNTLIVLVNPEDFIAVPHNEYTKARVCAYDIVGIMDSSGHLHANNGKSVKESTFEALIADLVAGKVMQPFEIVSVGNFGKTTITPIEGAVKGTMSTAKGKVASGKALDPVAETTAGPAADLVQKAKEAKTQASGVTIPDEVLRVFQMLVDGISKTEAARAAETSTRSIGRWIEKYGDPVELAKAEAARKAAEAVATPEPLVLTKDLQVADPANTVPQQAKRLFMLGLFEELKALKKAKKKSWISLGFTEAEIGQIEKAA